MRGSVVKKNDRYYVVIEDKHPATGKRIRRWHSGFRTKREAQAACNELVVAAQRGEYLAPSKQTVADFADEWLATIKATIRPSTLDKYRRDIRVNVVPYIGAVPLTKLDGPMLNRLWITLGETGKGPRKPHGERSGLSHKSIENVAMVMHRLLRDAVRWGRLTRNPADMADPPKRSAERKELKVWSSTTLRRFLEATENDELFPLWFFLATTGVRRGEALGLRWNDVDFETRRAKVIQTVTAIGWEIHYGQPKTNAGRRGLALDPATIDVLKAHRKRMLEQRLLVGAGFVDRDLVFCQPDGEPHHPERVYQAFKRALKKHGLPDLPIHGLRHTWATLALEADVHPKIVSERLGHSKIAITLDMYSQSSPIMHEEAAAKVARLVCPT